nr:reverse transcriptase domain-containing protein [Tanacetum cinerariifolium]
APTEGYEDAIVIPEIAANNFELKHGLINLVQNKQFFRHDKEDPHAHIRYFNKITSTMRVPSSLIKLMLFPFSLEGAARIWLKKELPRSILTWDDLLLKFINQFFPLLKMTNLRNEITRFQQRVDESFYEAWDRLNDLLRACPHHGFFELHQLDTFYNALNVNHQDSLNSAAGGNLLDKMPRECLKIIESKSKVRQSRAKAVVAKVSMSSSTSAISSDVAELKDLVRALLLDKKNQSSAPAPSSTPAPIRAIKQIVLLAVVLTRTKIVPLQAEMLIEITSKSQLHRPQVNQPSAYQAPAYQAPIPQTQSVSQTDFESCIKANDAVLRNMQNQGQNVQNQCQSLQIQMADLTDMLSKFMSSNTASSSGSGTLPSNTITNLKVELKCITTQSGVAYQGPTIPTQSKVMKQGTKVTKDQVQTPSSQSTAPVQPQVIQPETQTLISEPVVAPMPNLKSSIPYLQGVKMKDAEALSLLKLTPTCMTLELSDRSVSKPIGITKDVTFKVGVFHFPVDFMVVDFKPDPRVPLILERCFLKTDRALIDVHKGELTLRIRHEDITYNLDQNVELKDLPPHLKYAFLKGDNKLPVIITKELGDEEKSALIKVLNSHKRAITWKLSDIQGINQEFYTHKILMEEDYKPAEKSHFMVKEGIVLGHKILKNRIEVDRAKVDVNSKLPHPTTVKGVWSFLGHASFYRRFIQDFSKISRSITHLLEKNTPLILSEDCIKAF